MNYSLENRKMANHIFKQEMVLKVKEYQVKKDNDIEVLKDKINSKQVKD